MVQDVISASTGCPRYSPLPEPMRHKCLCPNASK